MVFSQHVSQSFLNCKTCKYNFKLVCKKYYTTRFIFWSCVMAPIYSQPRLAASQQAEISFLSPWHHVYQATPTSLSGTTCTLMKWTKQGDSPKSDSQPFTNLLNCFKTSPVTSCCLSSFLWVSAYQDRSSWNTIYCTQGMITTAGSLMTLLCLPSDTFCRHQKKRLAQQRTDLIPRPQVSGAKPQVLYLLYHWHSMKMDRFINTSLAGEINIHWRTTQDWGWAVIASGQGRSNCSLVRSPTGRKRGKTSPVKISSCKMYMPTFPPVRYAKSSWAMYVCTANHLLNVCRPEGGITASRGSISGISDKWLQWNALPPGETAGSIF